MDANWESRLRDEVEVPAVRRAEALLADRAIGQRDFAYFRQVSADYRTALNGDLMRIRQLDNGLAREYGEALLKSYSEDVDRALRRLESKRNGRGAAVCAPAPEAVETQSVTVVEDAWPVAAEVKLPSGPRRGGWTVPVLLLAAFLLGLAVGGFLF